MLYLPPSGAVASPVELCEWLEYGRIRIVKCADGDGPWVIFVEQQALEEVVAYLLKLIKCWLKRDWRRLCYETLVSKWSSMGVVLSALVGDDDSGKHSHVGHDAPGISAWYVRNLSTGAQLLLDRSAMVKLNASFER